MESGRIDPLKKGAFLLLGVGAVSCVVTLAATASWSGDGGFLPSWGVRHDLSDRVTNTAWVSTPGSSKPFLTFFEDGKVRGATASVRGRWYTVDERTVVAEWKRQIYVVTFASDLQTATVYRKGTSWPAYRALFQE